MTPGQRRPAVRRLVLACVAVACLAIAPLDVAVAPAAEAVSRPPVLNTGQDIGWPMCPAARGGRDKPMPPETALGFVIAELNAGLAFTANQCLADHYAWARARSSRLGGYIFPNYPDAPMLAAAAVGHYGKCVTLACRLKNTGWAQAEWDMQRLAETGVTLPMIWVDIEHQPRLGGTREWSRSIYDNRLVLTGVFDYLSAHHIRIGLYSYANGYREIVGSWALTYPEWIPTGTHVDADRATRCNQPGFAAGPVWLTQTTRAITAYDIDDDSVCPVASRALPLMFAASSTARPMLRAVRSQTLVRYAGLRLAYGARGPAVAAAQRALRIRADGVFGNATAAAVRKVQAAQRLGGTGVIDVKTWNALGA
jgi:hypothetical protein